MLGNACYVQRFVRLILTRCVYALLQVPGIGKVSEQTLNALGITSCGHLLQQRALISALFSSISSHFFLSAGLGLGATQHGSSRGDEGGAGAGGGVSRKGISCERTFANMSSPAEMEKMVRRVAFGQTWSVKSLC